MNITIDVVFATHGAQKGAQIHYDLICHTWTVYLANGLERTLYSIRSYAKFMCGGVA